MNFNNHKRWVAVLLASSILLAGCSVTPHKITSEQRKLQQENDLASLFSANYSEVKRYTLEEVIAYSLKNNLEHHLSLADIDLAHNITDLSRFEQLPQLAIGAGRINRNPQPNEDLDKVQDSANLSLAWNVLDFGVSYIKARQNSNRYLIAKEKQRLIENRLIKEVRRYFWRSLAAEQLEKTLKPIEIKLNAAIKNAKLAEMRRLQSPIKSLEFQKSLLEILSQLKDLQKSLSQDKIQLAKLMNISPSSQFELVMPENHEIVLDRQSLSVKDLEDYALNNRPEVYQADYQVKIQADETKKAMLRLLPGLELDYSRNYNSGDLYQNNVWAEAGLRLTWNLMNIFSAPKQIEVQENQALLQELKRLALSMSVLTQVNVAYVMYHQQLSHYELTQKIADVNKRLYQHADVSYLANELSEMELIRYEANLALSSIKKQIAYADLQDANAEMMLSTGAVLLPENYTSMQTDELTRQISEFYNSWIDNYFLRKLKKDSEGWIVIKEKEASNK